MPLKYKVIGSKKDGFAVVERVMGGVEYDLIETREGARAIRDVLNSGVDPCWNSVSAELEKRGQKVTFS
jgi:hypothetical protein